MVTNTIIHTWNTYQSIFTDGEPKCSSLIIGITVINTVFDFDPPFFLALAFVPDFSVFSFAMKLSLLGITTCLLGFSWPGYLLAFSPLNSKYCCVAQ